jgi:hypothetical protein
MPETPSVPEAFAALAGALAAEAMRDSAGFDRIAAFRKRVLDLAQRWENGEPPFTPRTPKATGVLS